MKQFFLLLAATLLACCSQDNETKAETPARQAATTGRTLVAYYSYTGDCRSIVNELTSQTEADVVEITPADKTQRYEANGYAIGTQLLNAIKANPNDAGSYPAIDPVTTSLDNYDNIIVVTPLWWSQMAAIMQTYLFRNASAMEGKHVALIVSSHSSGISGVTADAKRLLPGVEWMGEALWINNSNRSQTASLLRNWLPTLNFKQNTMNTQTMNISIDGQTRTVVLEDNAATAELLTALKQAPITYEADDYGGFEKVGALGRSLPTSNEQITTQAGDVILYSGNQMVLFYGSNSWSYTRIGRIQYETLDELKSFLKAGRGSISVTLSLPGTAAVSQAQDAADDTTYYSLSGQQLDGRPSHGICIVRSSKGSRQDRKGGKKAVL